MKNWIKESVKWNLIGIISLILVIIFIILSEQHKLDKNNSNNLKHLDSIEVLNLKDSVLNFIYDMRLEHPYIVYAQAVLESNDFTSNIFKENNNCFGMKVATVRQSTNKGSQYDHAVFDNWKDCIIDYALYQARYLSNIKTEEQYFTYLEQSYAEDPNYIQKLKSIIHNKKLREIFDLYETQTTN